MNKMKKDFNQIDKIQQRIAELKKLDAELWEKAAQLDPYSFEYFFIQAQIYKIDLEFSMLEDYLKKYLDHLLKLMMKGNKG